MKSAHRMGLWIGLTGVFYAAPSYAQDCISNPVDRDRPLVFDDSELDHG